jgi:hypothetical protein
VDHAVRLDGDRRLADLETGGIQGRRAAFDVVRRPACPERRLVVDLFGMHQPGWAFVEIVVLWLAIVATLLAFFRRSQLAGWLLVPYLAWVSFAAVLNFTIWRLNAG